MSGCRPWVHVGAHLLPLRASRFDNAQDHDTGVGRRAAAGTTGRHPLSRHGQPRLSIRVQCTHVNIISLGPMSRVQYGCTACATYANPACGCPHSPSMLGYLGTRCGVERGLPDLARRAVWLQYRASPEWLFFDFGDTRMRSPS